MNSNFNEIETLKENFYLKTYIYITDKSSGIVKNVVDARFCQSIPKSPWGGRPNKKQGPKAHQERQKENRKETIA